MVLENDGVLVDGKWSSFGSPTNTILPNQQINGIELISRNGKYKFKNPWNWFSTILIATGIRIMRSRSWTNMETCGRRMEINKFLWISVLPGCIDRPLTMIGIWEFTIFKETWMGGLLFGWFPIFSQMEDSKDSCDKKIQMTQTQSSSGLTTSTSAARSTKTIWVFRILPSVSPNA